MKKLIVIHFVIFLLLVTVIYIFIPGELFVSEVIFVKVTRNAAYRSLTDRNTWHTWWPSPESKKVSAGIGDSVFNYKNVDYTVNPKMIDVINLSLTYKRNVINSFINIISLNNDSVAIEWKSELQTNLNPVKKISAYFTAKKIKHDMGDILQNLKAFLEKQENIYGLTIKEEKVKDTLLIATKSVSNSYPATSTIYDLIKSLKDYILANGATETNYPMLHIIQDSGVFKTMVAIPVNKRIAENRKFLFKRMVPGRILVTEVKEGRYTCDKALNQLEIYIDDNHLSSPAIPFESLVTDRSREPDTAKWVTKIYYPIY